MTLFNEIDPFAASWLRNLFPDGIVDERSIKELQPDDLAGFRRVHLFSGIGGWELALQLAGWPEEIPVWTGSCPCQPFSAAGKRKGTDDDRHLWPEMFRLVSECRPPAIFGEQVAGIGGLGWLDGVFDDLEGIGYACWAADLPAACTGQSHKRQRLFWVAVAGGSKFGRLPESAGEHGRTFHVADGGCLDGLADSAGPSGAEQRRQPWKGLWRESGQNDASECPGPCGLGDPERAGPQGSADGGDAPQRHREAAERSIGLPGGIDRFIPCLDGKTRRIGPGVQPLAHGIPRDLGRGQPELGRMAKRARKNRVGRLRGYGNAIVPQVAALFVRVFLAEKGWK